MLRTGYAIFCMCTFSCFLISLGCKSSEDKFWKLLEKLDPVLRIPITGTVILKCFFACLGRFLVLIFTPILIAYFSFSTYNRSLTYVSMAIYIPMLYCHIYLLKLIYYIEVLSFLMEELQKNLRKRLNIHSAPKAYKALWRIYTHLNKTFSLGVLLATMAQLMSILFCSYHVLLGVKSNLQSKLGIYFTLWTIISVMRRTATTYHTFKTSALRVGHIIATDYRNYRMDQHESFRLQQMHFSLAFTVKSLYSIDNQHITEVCWMNNKKNGLWTFDFLGIRNHMFVRDNHPAVSLLLRHPFLLLKTEVVITNCVASIETKRLSYSLLQPSEGFLATFSSKALFKL